METLAKGDLVVLDFPFSDLSGRKVRPAVVVADPSGYDVIICQISSGCRKDDFCIDLDDCDLAEGSLKMSSLVRANFIFTADRSLILYRAGRLNEAKIAELEQRLVEMFTRRG